MLKSIFFISLMAVGCVDASVSDRIVKTTEVQIANPLPASLSTNVPPTQVSQTTSIDLSDALSKVNQFGTISLSIDESSLHSNSGDFSFVDEIKVDIAPDVNNTSGLPSITLVDVQPTDQEKTLSDLAIPILIDGNTLYQYLNSGALVATFTFTVSGQIPAQGLDVIDTLALDVSAQVNKSISDIGQ